MKKLKEKLNAKLSKNGGFTLIEMLIVVAIIAILVAVSIPLIGNALDQARHATDEANERSAKAEAAIVYLGEAVGTTNRWTFATGANYANTKYYDALTGKLLDDGTNITGYGKCTRHATSHDKQMLAVTVDKDGTAYLQWITAGTTATPDAWANTNLCQPNPLS